MDSSVLRSTSEQLCVAALSTIKHLRVIMDDSSWCMVDVDGQEIRVRIAHKDRGKFRIEDDVGGHYKGKIIDASDIISCNIDRIPTHT